MVPTWEKSYGSWLPGGWAAWSHCGAELRGCGGGSPKGRGTLLGAHRSTQQESSRLRRNMPVTLGVQIQEFRNKRYKQKLLRRALLDPQLATAQGRDRSHHWCAHDFFEDQMLSRLLSVLVPKLVGAQKLWVHFPTPATVLVWKRTSASPVTVQVIPCF